MGLDSRQVMSRMLSMLVLNLEYAKKAHAARKLDTMAMHNTRALKIIAFIRASFKEEYLQAPDADALRLAEYLRGFYQEKYIRLANLLLHRQPQAEFDYLLAALREQCQAWEGKAGQGAAAAPHAVPAARDAAAFVRAGDAPAEMMPPPAMPAEATSARDFFA
jgi:hypothetical protein